MVFRFFEPVVVDYVDCDGEWRWLSHGHDQRESKQKAKK